MANNSSDVGPGTPIGNGSSLSAPTGLGLVITPLDQLPRTRDFRSTSFDGRLREEGLDRQTIVAIDPIPPSGARGLASGAAQDATVHVPTNDGTSALVQIEHENGAITWYVPSNQSNGVTDITIPARDLAAVPVAPGSRGFSFGGLGKKLLKVFTFPITAIENGIGDIAAGFVRAWERKARPYLVRMYTPDLLDQAAPALEAADWDRLAQGRALLFVHGTFSKCDTFGALKPILNDLSDRYGGRLFAFNHPTMADDPAENARAFLDSIPQAAQRLTIDIVCHSRGGLVAREIANQGATRGVRVGRIVFVGATNNGTTLADQKYMVDMVNRYSTIAHVIPNRIANTVVDALVVVLKVAARALLNDMPGLMAMSPTGAFVKQINTTATSAEHLFAIASNFEPPVGSPFYSASRIEDAVVDEVFKQVENDLVVPTAGVFSTPAPDFPIDTPMIFDASAGVVHTQFFEHELTQKTLLEWLEPSTTRELAFTRGGRLTGDELQSLKPHVVNLHDGAFSTSGRFTTSKHDVDSIFSDSIPAFARSLPDGVPLRLMLWAHGGLVNEEDGLAVAQKHVEWWKRNGVYPIYFVWESGLFDALGSILSQAGNMSRGRGLTDFTDGIVEGIARRLRGDAIWSAMKTSATRASASTGGARYVLEQLRDFLGDSTRAQRPVELHAAGHSAGSIFHSELLPAAAKLKLPAFKTLQLLAPAIRVDEFKQRLMPLSGKAFEQVVMYTMDDAHEQDDTCAGVYRKSLLYLVYHALEQRKREPLVGLQISVDNDQELREFFFSDSQAARVVWSVTPSASGADATQSTSHGGFDDDAPTMTSVAINVLGGNVAAAKPYTGDARRGRSWPISSDLQQTIAVPTLQDDEIAAAPALALAKKSAHTVPPTGRRTALCVGIDAYPEPNRLSGCVSDARAWEKTLKENLGFQDIARLEDRAATRDTILSHLRQMVSGARAGDVLAFHYSGHGTTLEDDDGDEDDGFDEAMVPVDFESGNFIRDDDLRAIFSELVDGVSLTCFMDCCHSGTITRVLGRTSRVGTGKPRFMTIPPNSDIAIKDKARVQRERAQGNTRAFVDRTALKWINFSACSPTELAFESGGNGAFTRETVKLLKGGVAGVTNAELQQRIVAAFGPKRAQTPQLDCSDGAEHLPVLNPGAVATTAGTSQPVSGTDRRLAVGDRRVLASPMSQFDRRSGARRSSDLNEYVSSLRETADFLEQLGRNE